MVNGYWGLVNWSPRLRDALMRGLVAEMDKKIVTT